MTMNKNYLLLAVAIMLLISLKSMAAPTNVGNGDDGTDLEGFAKLESGPLIESQLRAVNQLRKLNISNIKGLGNLINEIEKNNIYMTNKDVSAKKMEEMGAFHAGLEGKVYARTFSRPHAPTRFFPASLKLSQNQLMALHIHEGLHRALPEEIRDDEKKVSNITLAIISPESTYDQINQVVMEVYPDKKEQIPAGSYTQSVNVSKDSKLNNPSSLELSFRSFGSPKQDETKLQSLPISSIYSISSHLYPFGKNEYALGTGIDISYIKQDDGKSYMGPLGLSLRKLIFTMRGFDLETYGRADLHTLSDEELKNSLMGRDIYKVGVSLIKTTDIVYIQNDLEYTAPSEVKETIANINYTYKFGSTVAARIKAGGRYKNFHAGGFFEMLVSTNFTVESDNSDFGKEELGRNRVVALGPEIMWGRNNFDVKFYGRYLLNSSKETDFDQLGDLMGTGVGQGNLGLSVSYKF